MKYLGGGKGEWIVRVFPLSPPHPPPPPKDALWGGGYVRAKFYALQGAMRKFKLEFKILTIYRNLI